MKRIFQKKIHLEQSYEEEEQPNQLPTQRRGEERKRYFIYLYTLCYIQYKTSVPVCIGNSTHTPKYLNLVLIV